MKCPFYVLNYEKMKVANQIHFLRILCGGYHEMEFLNFFIF